MRLILLIVLILLLVGALPTWHQLPPDSACMTYSSEWGYYPSSGLGLLLIVLIVLAVMGVI